MKKERLVRCVICKKMIDSENDTFIVINDKYTCERCYDRISRNIDTKKYNIKHGKELVSE